MKQIIISLRLLIFLSILTGLIYPVLVTGIGETLFRHQAQGSLVQKDGQNVGSALLAQKFVSPNYFWPRPSSQDYNPMPSGGSNLSQVSSDLKKAWDDRHKILTEAQPSSGEPPQDLLFASGSGLDPEVSPEAALYQSSRVAQARAVSVADIQGLVREFTQGPSLGFLGESRVNILLLNLALDQKFPVKTVAN